MIIHILILHGQSSYVYFSTGSIKVKMKIVALSDHYYGCTFKRIPEYKSKLRLNLIFAKKETRF